MGEKGSAILVLEDGTVFKGKAIGKIGTTGGEIAFNTGMTGYQEVFTDPSYYGQLLIMTTAHIGNYGTQSNEQESDKINISGLITKKFSDGFSRTSGDQSLQDFMVHHETVGISDIDTRALVRHIRDKGAMNAIISSSNLNEENLKKDVLELPKMNGLELSSKVTTADAYEVLPDNVQFKVSLLDLGVKRNIVQCLVERGCHVKVFPLHSSKEDLTSFNPDGYMLSNGPGDPSAMPETITLVKEIIATGKPVFGICLGHQIFGLSQGLKTEKMFNGHRGINHPIKNLKTGKGEITSQNHGFVISKDSVEDRNDIEVTHIHLNDHTIAGIALKDKPVFSVQYHPEASAGPHDSRYLFDSFIENMKSHKN
ncbi:glutamine-hydrolyzing carbamoyl-phosphate synthase small subunit [Crocinitomicaceae bacterium]|jgi:carbamoyl-phosphate synthase small subunit|nr:glutamine-hydrolyzing carbamoyl-phosphate synthase small subunit [Crocinitomicaceae bacterium]